MSSTLPTTRSPAPMANRISVSAGVSDTIFWGSLLSSTFVAASSVRVIGKTLVGGTDAARDSPGVAVVAGKREPVASTGVVGRGVDPPLQADRTTARTTVARIGRRRVAESATWGERKAGTSGSRSRGWRGARTHETPRFNRTRGGQPNG